MRKEVNDRKRNKCKSSLCRGDLIMDILKIDKPREKTQRLMFILLLLISVGSLSGCRTVSRSFDYDREQDFTTYKTFNWAPLPAANYDKPALKNTMIDKRFKRALKEKLELKGYTFDTENADFLVVYYAPVREQKNVTRLYNSYFHYGYFRHGHSLHTIYPFYDDFYIDSYDEATLIIDIIDGEQNELVWRGWKSESVYGPSISETKNPKGH